MAYRLTKEQVLEAIQNSQGLISTVKAHLKNMIGRSLDWHTVKDYVDKWEETRKALQDETEMVLDVAENKVFQEIYKGDVTTAKWYLRMKGKDRGYEDNPILKLDNGEPLNIQFAGQDQATLAAASNVEINNGEDDATE